MIALEPFAQDAARFVDRRIALSMCVPANPQLVSPAASAGVSEPTYDALVVLRDIPVSVRYRLSEQPAPALDASLFAQTYAANRCRREDLPRAQAAFGDQLRAWNVEAAASAMYPLADPDASGDDMEEVLVLVKSSSLVTITKRFARERTSSVAWALCNSAIASSIRWGNAPVAPPLWPDSTFLVPGVSGTIRAARREQATRLAQLAAPHGADAVRLADRAATLMRGSDAPAQPIGAADLAAIESYLVGVADDRDLAAALSELLRDVRTAHDLRGVALLVLHALGKHAATFEQSGAEDQRAFGHLTE